MYEIKRKAMRRFEELDYMKCVFILLMIAFHLVYIGDTYPYAKQIVYTFHMPGFLVISGYLFNVNKPLRRFLRSMLWIFVPYAIMESGYVLAASMLPIREHIEHLTLPLLFGKLTLNPLGPYWYLHTLMVCGAIYYVSARIRNHFRSRCISVAQKWLVDMPPFVAFPAVAAALPHCGVALSFTNTCYFLAGMAIRQYARNFIDVFWTKPWTILPLAFIACFPAWLDRAHPAGVLMVYFVMCFLMYLYRQLPPALAL